MVLACFGLSLAPNAFGVSPPPDGGYPGFNTAEGQNALFGLTTGAANTAIGWYSLFSNTEGSYNTGVGAGTLLFNIGNQSANEGIENTAMGTAALLYNTTGSFNTAVGTAALLSNTNGVANTATGTEALNRNTTGSDNTAHGVSALVRNTTGDDNTANGSQALYFNMTGEQNTATGVQALYSNIEGGDNTAIGRHALYFNTGNNNIALGAGAGISLFSGNDNIYIGHSGFGVESATIRIGGSGATIAKTFIAGIRGTAVAGDTVVVDADGQLGTMASSQRFKDAIKPMDKASEAILALKPVTFHYKQEIDRKGIPQFGLVAEEVEKVNPDLVARDAEGKVYTVRYEAVNAMLLNEFLKAHRRIEEQDKRIDQLTAQLKEQALLIQKVNDKVELNRPATQTVADDR